MSHIVRINPITGEELHYYKGQVNASKITAEPVSNPNHKRFPRDGAYQQAPYQKTIPNQHLEQDHYTTSNNISFVSPLLMNQQHTPRGNPANNPPTSLATNVPMSARPVEANTPRANPISIQPIDYNIQHPFQANRKPLAEKSSDDLSLIANASSIPVLNFGDLNLDEDNEKKNPNIEKYKADIDAIRSAILNSKVAQLRDKNPIVGPVQQEKSARPQSSYRHGFQHSDSLNSPIMAYNNNKLKIDSAAKHLQQQPQQPQQQPKTTGSSKLDAPRETFRVEDTDLLNTLSKPLIAKKRTIYTVERVADLERLWINSSAITERSKQRQDNQHKSNQLIESMVVERILTDQLNDPFQQRWVIAI